MVDYHPFSDAIFDDPYPIYKRLRDESPLHYLEEFDCWFVSRFEDVWSLEQDQRNLTSKFGTTSTHLVTKQTPISPNLSGLDPPQHGPVRSFFNPPFKPGAVAALEPRVRAFAREAIAAVRERGAADAVIELGGYVASRVVCTILGLPLEDAGQVLAWVNTYFEREPGHARQHAARDRGRERVRDVPVPALEGAARARRTRGQPHAQAPPRGGRGRARRRHARRGAPEHARDRRHRDVPEGVLGRALRGSRSTPTSAPRARATRR